MNFYTKDYKIERIYPCMVLEKDNWDDFGSKITFDIYYYKDKRTFNKVHSVKILDKNAKNTILEPHFTKIAENQCSIGVSMEYYENLKFHFNTQEISSILQNLNDISFDNTIADKFKDIDEFHDALLRFPSTVKAFEEAAIFIKYNERKADEDLAFIYSFKILEATSEHKVSFNFKKNDYLPYRINVLIGKNGTGKTQYLGSMVNAIAGIGNRDRFEPSIPLFNKVIAISYSLFDNFPIPRESPKFSYKYIGLKDSENDVVSNQRLTEKLRNALHLIIQKERTPEFYGVINKIINLSQLGLNHFNDINKEWIETISFENTKRLSSGQSITFLILTELIANIQLESLILFDEPETHLHPSAVAELINCLYDILETFNSYAVISTHSPIVLQDIPSKYVNVFHRQENLPIIKKLAIECFGENISEITNTVFDTVDVKEMYKTHLENLNEDYTISTINGFFENKLSFNAMLYLSALDKIDFNEKP